MVSDEKTPLMGPHDENKGVAVDLQKEAFDLLKRLFDENRGPFVVDSEHLFTYCYFCDEEMPGHTDGCIFIAAQKLVEAVKNVGQPAPLLDSSIDKSEYKDE